MPCMVTLVTMRIVASWHEILLYYRSLPDLRMSETQLGLPADRVYRYGRFTLHFSKNLLVTVFAPNSF
jgi:hypothetical protein